MNLGSIIEGRGYWKVSKMTKPNTYRLVHKSFFDAGSLEVRDNVGWAVAELIVVDEICSLEEESHILMRWRVLVNGDPIQPSCQKLVLTNDGTQYKLYDSFRTMIAKGRLQDIIPLVCLRQRKSVNQSLLPYQLIIYGAPGTGKSWRINRDTEGCEVVRTTFHPDSDYSTFVGAYKPTIEIVPRTFMKGEEIARVENGDADLRKEKQIVYKFVAQAFVKAYVNAWKALICAAPEGEVKPQYLIIEEINRGNCAQIFGDLFQLLDRNDEGFSDYEIAADDDLRQYLAEVFKDLKSSDAVERVPAEVAAKLERILRGEILLLPSNLYIWATMNTSDQSLFPIDSAFKRRWEWRYVPISDGGKGWKIRVIDPENAGAAHEYDWWAFLEKANALVQKFTDSEDKKLGYYFCKANVEGVISLAQFVGKVVFYLWNSVFKDADSDDAAFKDGTGGFLRFSDFFDAKGDPNAGSVRQFLQNLEVPEITRD